MASKNPRKRYPAQDSMTLLSQCGFVNPVAGDGHGGPLRNLTGDARHGVAAAGLRTRPSGAHGPLNQPYRDSAHAAWAEEREKLEHDLK